MWLGDSFPEDQLNDSFQLLLPFYLQNNKSSGGLKCPKTLPAWTAAICATMLERFSGQTLLSKLCTFRSEIGPLALQKP